MISLLSTTTCNHIDNYKNFVNSINYPVKTLSVLVNNSNIDYFDQVRNVPESEFVEKYEYSYCPRNMGCASSWNYHIKHHPQEEYWVLCSDDVQLGPNELSDIHRLMGEGYDAAFADKDCNYILFALNRNMIRKIGLFDENIHPGCYEDNDYRARISLCPDIKTTTFVVNSMHNGAPAGSGKGGGGTGIHFTHEQSERWKVCLAGNERYFRTKWSSFNAPPWYWIFDIDERAKKELII